ncbi:hypothetical protein A1O1_07488 [Capronia coronata CBS 617.96]|uniref:DNA-directed RNA polymerase I subunit RPA49 n=1 Tax=Capronia coronata CBS 617.96 TaxID=1182541 RepID=W9Y2M0_9EURO|nr:uncharacterized protein A1O1_07488 [Capronia coronata CBS 617.96]EXJ83860.1 hypothetical protein A1O1_07488 [Capronia coronata CBS 617.96]
MGEKKRKAGAQEATDRPTKKPQTSKAKVTYITGPDVAKPVVAFSPGFTLPPELKFNAFSKKTTTSSASPTSLLLQTSDHPTIDYVATESNTTEVGERHMKHYVAVFDPSSKSLRVTEAKKVTVRSSVRQVDQRDGSDGEENDTGATPTWATMPSSRAALTEAFGTKKSKKAVASVAENRLLARGGEKATDSPVSNAILWSIKDEDDPFLDTKNTSDATVLSRANKPLPPANLDTTEIEEVYGLSALVFPAPARTTLAQMPLAYWRERIGAKKDVVSRYRFVAHRVDRLTRLHLENPDDQTTLLKLQLLRYIQLLLELYTYITRLPARKPIPQPEQWPDHTTSDASLSTAFLSKLVAHFFPTSIPTAQAKTLLTTTILALTLHIPPPKWQPGVTMPVLVTEPSDISLDLALQPTEVSKLFRELGCKMESLADMELARWGWEKKGKARKIVDEDGKETTLPKPKFAKLRFPIEFPKISAGRPSRR